MWGRNNTIFITSNSYRDDNNHSPNLTYYSDPLDHKRRNEGADHVGTVNMA